MMIYKADSTLFVEDLKSVPIVVAIGVFDGVHRGHKKIIKSLLEVAALKGARSCIFTFDRNPKDSCIGEKAILSNDDKYSKLKELGIEIIVEMHFSPEMKKMPGSLFFSRLLSSFDIRGVVVGNDFRCGSLSSQLDAMQLSSIYPDLVKIVEDEIMDGKKISSTEIRRIIKEKGDWKKYL